MSLGLFAEAFAATERMASRERARKSELNSSADLFSPPLSLPELLKGARRDESILLCLGFLIAMLARG